MMEKDAESISTVQLKPEYAASEIYSTVSGSEPPPAYKMRPSNAVQIAKIVSLAVIVSSLIIGSFILASSYIQARAACDQMQALDNMLGKELMLETLQDLPKPEALSSNSLKEEEINNEKIDEVAAETDQPSEDETNENDLSEDAEKVHIRMPMELDLSDLAGALLMNQNQQARMNCVVERRRTEEVVDAPARNVQLPFGMNISTDPKKQKITGERIAIFCDNGNEKKEQPTEGIPRVVAMHVNAVPIQFRPQFPLTHMPFQQINQQAAAAAAAAAHQQQQQERQAEQIQHAMPQFRFGSPQPQHVPQNQFQSFRQIPLPLQPLIRQIQQAHSNEYQRNEQPEVRIQLQRIAVPISHEMQMPQQQHQEQQEQQPQMPQIPPQVQVQRVPLAVALQRAGITAEDLKNIQRMAEQRIQQELRELAQEESEGSSEEDDSSEENRPHPLAYGRMAFGRSLAHPVNLPVPIQQIVEDQAAQQENAETPAAAAEESERPHYVQPRSV